MKNQTALQWLQQHGGQWGLDTQRLAIGGDSAGGTLSAVCALMARDAGLTLALQLLFYPGTTAHQNTASHHTFADGFMLDQATVDWFFAQYIDKKDRDDWRFAPLNAPDHAGLAPAWLGLAECDPLVDAWPGCRLSWRFTKAWCMGLSPWAAPFLTLCRRTPMPVVL